LWFTIADGGCMREMRNLNVLLFGDVLDIQLIGCFIMVSFKRICQDDCVMMVNKKARFSIQETGF